MLDRRLGRRPSGWLAIAARRTSLLGRRVRRRFNEAILEAVQVNDRKTLGGVQPSIRLSSLAEFE
jgi:hypothetical protein